MCWGRIVWTQAYKWTTAAGDDVVGTLPGAVRRKADCCNSGVCAVTGANDGGDNDDGKDK